MQIEEFCQCVGCTTVQALTVVNEMTYVFGFRQTMTLAFLKGLFEKDPLIPFEMFREYLHGLAIAKEMYAVSQENELPTDFEGTLKAMFIINKQRVANAN